MTDATLRDSRTVPSLAELRAHAADVVCLKSLSPEHRALIVAYPILLDIAEAARSMFETASYGGTNYDIEFEGDTSELRLRVGTLLQLHWKTLTDEQLLAIKAICDKAAGVKPSQDPRIEAWRALDAEQRRYRVEDLRTWADLVEAGTAPDGADHGPSPLRIAAAALEALGEKP